MKTMEVTYKFWKIELEASYSTEYSHLLCQKLDLNDKRRRSVKKEE